MSSKKQFGLTLERGLCGLHLHALHRSVLEVHREIAGANFDHRYEARRPATYACVDTFLEFKMSWV